MVYEILNTAESSAWMHDGARPWLVLEVTYRDCKAGYRRTVIGRYTTEAGAKRALKRHYGASTHQIRSRGFQWGSNS
jgi:hypothetical protein